MKYSMSLPANPSPRRRERSGSCAIHSRMWTYTYLFFFFSNKQKLAIYLLAIFVIWSLLLTHNSLFFFLQFFKFFLKKYAKNLSFFLFCLYPLKNAKEQWIKVHSNKAIPLTAIGAKSSSASCETKVKQEKRTQFTKFPNISFCNCQVKAKSDKRRHWSWFIHCAMWLI